MEMNRELIAKAKATESPEELMALAKENDIELTEENAKAYFEQLNPPKGELSDAELDNIAGGGCYSKDGRLVVSALHKCNNFSGIRGIRNNDEYAECCNCRHCSYEKGLWLCNYPDNRR